jgi:hypothetical protein
MAIWLAIGGLLALPVRAAEPRPQNPLNALQAYRYLEQICELGPRISGSPAMTRQQELLTKHFEALGGKVIRQEFEARNPLGGENVPMTNLIVQWHPERNERILLCAHYDTRPLPDRDPNPVNRRQGVFLGANDGGSGVAVLMELAHLMPGLEGPYGVDFVLFDGEELVWVDERDPYFLGSNWFARQYNRRPPPYRYRWGVLLDMVGDADLQIYQEQQSVACGPPPEGWASMNSCPGPSMWCATTTWHCGISPRFRPATSSISTTPPGTPRPTRHGVARARRWQKSVGLCMNG